MQQKDVNILPNQTPGENDQPTGLITQQLPQSF